MQTEISVEAGLRSNLTGRGLDLHGPYCCGTLAVVAPVPRFETAKAPEISADRREKTGRRQPGPSLETPAAQLAADTQPITPLPAIQVEVRRTALQKLHGY